MVINAAREDPVEAVRSLTGGVGADIVIYAVGGREGAKAFLQALDMLAVGGLLHLIGLCEPEPLPLPSTKIQGRRLLGGYYGRANDAWTARTGMELLASGAIDAAAMTTHRFPANARRRRLCPAARATGRGPRRDPGVGRGPGLSAA